MEAAAAALTTKATKAAQATFSAIGLGLGLEGLDAEGVARWAAGVDWDAVQAYVGLVGLALFAVCVGAHMSLPWPKKEKKDKVKGEGKDEDEDEEEDEDEDTELVSAEDVWVFPIIASGALVGLYAIVKYLGEGWINRVLGWYFAVAGVGAVWNAGMWAVRKLAGEARWRTYERVTVSVKLGARVIVAGAVRWPGAVLVPVAAVPGVVYALGGGAGRSAVLTDVLGLAFAVNGVGVLRLDGFRTGCLLLAGLFVYDVWWVFGTDVMVTVATKLDVPVKLLWAKGGGHSLLGLGDVVIPGTFVALGLRCDRARGTRAYFWATLGGYACALVGTMVVVQVYGRAQPALLYISPGCILAFVATGLVRGEMGAVWKWQEGGKK